MKPENSITPSAAQDPGGQLDRNVAPGAPMPQFTARQISVIVDLLKAERAHASRWWTFLQELRLHRQLPEWVENQVIGCHPDYDLWSADCLATNLNLLGIDAHLNAFDSSQLVDCSKVNCVGADTDSAPQNEQVPFRGAQLGGGQ